MPLWIDGHRVRVLDALVSQVHGENASPCLFELQRRSSFRATFAIATAVDAALEDIDVVFHEAAEVGVGQSMYEIERYVRANDLVQLFCSKRSSSAGRRSRNLWLRRRCRSMAKAHTRVQHAVRCTPQLRPSSQLLDRRWEVECPKCAKPVTPNGTTEEKATVSDFGLCSDKTGPGTVLSGRRPIVWNTIRCSCATSMFMEPGKRFRILTLEFVRSFRRVCSMAIGR